jgi:hypothetical protein
MLPNEIGSKVKVISGMGVRDGSLVYTMEKIYFPDADWKVMSDERLISDVIRKKTCYWSLRY